MTKDQLKTLKDLGAAKSAAYRLSCTNPDTVPAWKDAVRAETEFKKELGSNELSL